MICICAKSENNLTISDIMILAYAEKFTATQDKFQAFWKDKYSVYDVPEQIRKLCSGGIIAENDGKYKLTELGCHELKLNDYVVYFHKTTTPFPGLINVWWLNEKLYDYPNIKYRDLIWGELNQLSIDASERAAKWGLYGSYIQCRKAMGVFLIEEGRFYTDAIGLLAEAAYYELNKCVPSITSSVEIADIRDICKNDLSIKYFKKIVKATKSTMDELYTDILFNLHRCLLSDGFISNVNLAELIASETFGKKEMADEVYYKIKEKLDEKYRGGGANQNV